MKQSVGGTMKIKYKGIDLIVLWDECGFLSAVLLPDSSQDLMEILSCDTLKYCSEQVNKKYMDLNVEAYR